MMTAHERADAAIESAQSPPDPLEFPQFASPNDPSTSIGADALRDRIEDAANVQICRVLMTDAHQAVPAALSDPKATFASCPASFQNMVKNRQGVVRWASGAKPSECGLSCMSRPQLWRSSDRDRPNANDVMISGKISLEVEVPGPNRDVVFSWKAYAECKMAPGGPVRLGKANLDVVVDAPVVGSPGFFAGALSFFLLPAQLTERITNGIKAKLPSSGSTSGSDLGFACSTVGMSTATAWQHDTLNFGTKLPLMVGTGRTATIRLVSIARKPVSGYTPPADGGSFTLYANGVEFGIPIALAPTPPVGGTTQLNMCKTIDMDGFDRLQIILANTLGGTTWSQFASADGFGAGKAHTMSTGRTVVVAGVPTPGNTHPKPSPLLINEFELTYTVDYHSPSNPLTSRGQTDMNGGPARTITNAAAAQAQQLGGTPQPCRQL
jgi:hypothetical protein